MLIEDVACPVDKLGDMTQDLVDMFQKYGYKDASCFGHALEGNLHLVFSQGFRSPEEVQRFSDMMEEMCYIVATKHSGSLKVCMLCHPLPLPPRVLCAGHQMQWISQDMHAVCSLLYSVAVCSICS